MRELLNTFFKSTEERIKNPFIGSFITSWIVFNWKPIIFLILSSKIIESKIVYIEENFSNIWYVFLFPLIAGIFYVLILPYINLVFDELLKYSVIKRNSAIISKKIQIIQDEEKLAIEEIKLEEAKTEYRERNTHNKLVEELQNQIKNTEELMLKEKERSSKLNKELKDEFAQRENMINEEISNLQKRISDSRAENFELKEAIYSKENRIQELSSRLKENEEDVNTIYFDNGLELTERMINGSYSYSDDDERRLYSVEEAKNLMKSNNYKRVPRNYR